MKPQYEVLKDFKYADRIPLSAGDLVAISPNTAGVYVDQKFLKLVKPEALTKKEKSVILREEGAE
jgi:hypothetical protein